MVQEDQSVSYLHKMSLEWISQLAQRKLGSEWMAEVHIEKGGNA